MLALCRSCVTVKEIFDEFRPGAAFFSAVNTSAQGFVDVVRICDRYCPAMPTACVSVNLVAERNSKCA